MVVIGIDGGLTGAIAFLHPDRAIVVDLPTVPLDVGGVVQRRVHGPALASIVRQFCPRGEPILAVVEDLATGGQGSMAQTNNSQYRTRGTIECALEMLGLEVKAVPPQRWKKMYGLVANRKSLSKPGKKDSLALARELYPALSQGELRLALHHNRAEAALIAHWARKVLA